MSGNLTDLFQSFKSDTTRLKRVNLTAIAYQFGEQKRYESNICTDIECDHISLQICEVSGKFCLFNFSG